MGEASVWLAPLLFLPAVGVLIVSTSARYGGVHAAVQQLAADAEDHRDPLLMLLRRAHTLRNALVTLYSAATGLALAGLVGAVTFTWGSEWRMGVLLLTGAAIAAVMLATGMLIREAHRSLHVIESHVPELAREART